MSSWTNISEEPLPSSTQQKLDATISELTTRIASLERRLAILEDMKRAKGPSGIGSLALPLFGDDPRAQHVRESNRALRRRELIPFDRELGQV